MSFSQLCLKWFDQHGRHDLPWQQEISPYRVWVSEIMLQQTQVKTVIPYYQRFMKSFPSIEKLASATQEEVLAHWAGLGYYARGRNLHKSAIIIQSKFQGLFPQTFDDIIALPGIGQSTAGAIMSIALKQRMPILDGNVKRVLCRFDAVTSWSGNKKTEKILWDRADEFTPQERFDDYTQAIMDLGATLCTRSKPKCDVCPVEADCDAKKMDKVIQFPYSKPKKIIPTKEKFFLILVTEAFQVALVKRPEKGIWGGLWSLPEFDSEQEIALFLDGNGVVATLKEQAVIKHTFSHYHLRLKPMKGLVRKQEIEGVKWFALPCEELGLPAPIRKIVGSL